MNSKGNPRHIDIAPGIARQDIRDALVACQPYKAVEDFGHDLWENHLWLVNELNNIDKHRLLLIAVHRIDFHEGPWWEGEGVDHFQFWPHALETDQIVARITFKHTVNPRFDPHITLAVTLDEGPMGAWPSSRSVTGLLAGLRWNIAWDAEFRFRQFFPGEAPIELESAPALPGAAS